MKYQKSQFYHVGRIASIPSHEHLVFGLQSFTDAVVGVSGGV